MNLLKQAKEVFRIEIEALSRITSRLDRSFEKAVRTLTACRGKVIVTGVGKSGLIGRKIASTLASTGTPALFIHATEGVHGDLGVLSKNDVVLAISNSGETEEISGLLPLIKRLGVPLITLTGRPHSSLAKVSDTMLDCSVREEACPLGLAPTASSTAALVMGDALAVTVLAAKKFKAEDFARLHPKGFLGKKLLRISSIMHTGKEIPSVGAKATLKTAVLEMTGKRMGCTAVVNGNRRLLGLFTDHDLRKLLQKTPNLNLNRIKIMDVMNPKPRTIRQDELVAKAVHITEAWSVGTLLVTDEAGRLAGIIHLHDLLKIK